MTKSCCCSESSEMVFSEALTKDNGETEVPELISSAEETFQMGKSHKLTASATAQWELHKEIIDDTIKGGWDNKDHSWGRDRQAFWRYPLAFSAYAIPSLLMIDNDKYDEGIDCLRKSILLMKDIGIWDDWTRLEFGKDPVTTQNAMYKGHLNLMYGLYTLLSGDDQFEQEYHHMTKIITSEYENNARNRGFWLIECEPDQCFTPCNSNVLMSLKIYDILYGTNYEDQFIKPVIDFIKKKVTDHETGMTFIRYHPSHDYSEAVLTGDMWTLGMYHALDPKHFEYAYESCKREFIRDIRGGKSCYLKAAKNSEGASTDHEQKTWGFYVPFGAKEYNDSILWEKINRYFRELYETEICDGKIKFNYGEKSEETMVSCYLLLGDVHLGWQTILDYDWNSLRNKMNREGKA